MLESGEALGSRKSENSIIILQNEVLTRYNETVNTLDNDISVVVPIYNEEEVLPHFYRHLSDVLGNSGLSYEIIFVNDGSSDKSFQIMEGLNCSDRRIKVLSFSRNFGHQVAITAGLNFSKARASVVMDGDLQDPPEVILEFIEKWKSGYEVVYGVRTKRKEHIFKRELYSIYYKLLRRMSNIDIPLDSGDFCLMDSKVVALLNSIPERNRFIRGLRRWVGFRQIGIIYERGRRYAGKPKYTYFRLLKLGLDGIISFSGIPLKSALVAGFFVSLLSVVYSFVIVLHRILHTKNQIPGWTSIVAGVTFLGGIQLMVMGILGEYIIRIYEEVKRRPMYILNAVVGFQDADARSLSNNSSL